MKGYKLHVYRAKDGWRWQMTAGNGKIVAESGEAYTNRSKCIAGFTRVQRNITKTTWVLED
jgi:uncharacterized protein YegP (UPF0339 family)